MAQTPIMMPQLNHAMTEGRLVKWLKHGGDEVLRGEPIATIETDGVMREVTSFTSGTIAALLINQGDTVSVGATIATLDNAASGAVADARSSKPTTPTAPMPIQLPRTTNYTAHRLSRLRQIAAKRMVESQQQIPPFFITTSIEMDAALAFLPQLQAAHGGRVSVTELLLKGCALALQTFPALNSTFGGDRLLQPDGVHISVAVATNAGLLAPVVRDCATRSLGALSNSLRESIARARNGKATLDDLTGGTFTISNLSMFNVQHFVAIITPPQSAVLAVGSPIATPVVRNGEIVVRHLMNVTISVDHRVADGVTAAQFLQTLADVMQNPLKLLV